MKYSELLQLRESVSQKYFELYSSNGFVILPSLSLDQKEDLSLDYVTCTICSAKKNILNNITGDDYVQLQQAIRNTHIDVIGKKNEHRNFISSFTMIGGYKYILENKDLEEEFNRILLSEYQYLSNFFKGRIILTIPQQYALYLPISKQVKMKLIKENCIIKYSLYDEQNLKWNYGMDNVVGYGTRWEVVTKKDNIINFGNTVSVLKNGQPIGIDFGGGFDTLISAINDERSVLYASNIATDKVADFCKNDILNEKIIDCLTSIMTMIFSKEKIILRDAKIVNKYYNLLISLMILQDVSRQEIEDIVEDICTYVKYDYSRNIEKFFELFDKYYIHFLSVCSNDYMGKVVNTFEKCYNRFGRVDGNLVIGPYRNYFNNLSEIELLAIKKQREGNSKDKKLIRSKLI